MNILITGGAGFIGSNIADQFIADGHRVIVADDLSTGKVENINKQSIFYQVDIRSSEFEKIFQNEKIDIVYHLAAQIDVRKSLSDPIHDAEINILGGIQLLKLMREHNIPKIVYSSTGGAIYGEPEYLPADEMHPIRPLAAYGISKHALEHYIELYHDLYGLKYTIFRYANVYGKRQDPLGEAGVIAIFAGKMEKGESPVIFGDGTQTRDFVHVDDVVAANKLALTKGSGEIFNIGTGVETSVTMIYEALKARIPQSGEVVYAPARKGEVQRIALDVTKARKVLGWSAQHNLEQGLALTL